MGLFVDPKTNLTVTLNTAQGQGDAPNVCVECGGQGVSQKVVRLASVPRWVDFTAPLIWVWLLLRLICTRRVVARLPLCLPHYRRWFWRRRLRTINALLLVPLALIHGLLGLTWVRSSPTTPEWVLGSFVYVTVALSALVLLDIRLRFRLPRVGDLRKDSITLTGVNQEFYQALAEFQNSVRPTRPRHALDQDEVFDETALAVWVAMAAAQLLACGVFWAASIFFLKGLAVQLCLFAVGAYVYVYLHTRWLRREELLLVLRTAITSGHPLVLPLRAYHADLQPQPVRAALAYAAQFLVFPGFGWIWHRYWSFDHQVEKLISYLEAGIPLSHALDDVSGAASSSTVLKAAIGEATGRLAECLRPEPQRTLAAIGLEIATRLAYLGLMICCLLAAMTFTLLFIVPKYQKIFADLRVRLPEVTERVLAAGTLGIAMIPALVLVFGGMGVLLLISPSLRWYFPAVAVVQRPATRSRLMGMLGLLLQAGMTVPEALQLLASMSYFRGPAARGLSLAYQQTRQGQSLAEVLGKLGLLPRGMAAMVTAAERARNLPWALQELSRSLYARALQRLERTFAVLFPVSIVLLGLGVGVFVLALFYPLVAIMNRL